MDQNPLSFISVTSISAILVALLGIILRLFFKKGLSIRQWLAIIIIQIPIIGIFGDASKATITSEEFLAAAILVGVAFYLWRKETFISPHKQKSLQIERAFKDYELSNTVVHHGKVEKTESVSSIFTPKIKGFPSIPSEIAELIWFVDGPLKNYDAADVGHKIDLGYGLQMHMYMTTDIEPSAVSTQLTIKQPKNLLFVQSVGYYPQYNSLTPEQRWKYLHWLTNIDEATDLGYIFLYYYGLERHLFLGEFEKAFKIIIRLRKYHTTSSFPAYSMDALLASLLFHQRTDLYDLLEMSLTERGEIITSDLHLYVKYLLQRPLTIPEIIHMASGVGFTNNRYIKTEYDVFYHILSEQLYLHCGTSFMQWKNIDIKHCPQGSVGIVANTSLNPRTINIPKLSKHKGLSSTLLEILKQTHEETKVRLRSLRKLRSEI